MLFNVEEISCLEARSFDSGAADDSSRLGCDAASTGEYRQQLFTIVTASYSRRLEPCTVSLL
jgi:hypothetical protein